MFGMQWLTKVLSEWSYFAWIMGWTVFFALLRIDPFRVWFYVVYTVFTLVTVVLCCDQLEHLNLYEIASV